MEDKVTKTKSNKKKKNKQNCSTGLCSHSSASTNVSNILPQKIGEKTLLNEIEVTMTSSNVSSFPANPTESEKKQQNQLASNVLTTTTKGIKCQPSSAIQCSENKIKLINHPEISISTTGENFTPSCISAEPEVSQPSSNTAKKKKKKKKKEQRSDSDQKTISNLNENIKDSPTYVKLPANDDTCVLVVSHERFNHLDENKSKQAADKIMSSCGNSINSEIIKKNVDDVSKSDKNDGISKNYLNKPSTNSSVSTQKSISDSIFSINPVMTGCNNMCSDSNNKVNANVSETSEMSSSKSVEKSLSSKAQLKAERRALQEAQRAAKSAIKIAKDKSNIEETVVASSMHSCNEVKSKGEKVQNVTKVGKKDELHKIGLFSHLPQFRPQNFPLKFSKTYENIHPAVETVGAQYAAGIICGSNARCVAMLAALKEVIKDYKTPPKKELSRDLDENFQMCLNFMAKCRPLSVSMINAMKFLKYQVTHITSDIKDEKAKEILYDHIEKFVKEEILLAKDAITSFAAAKIVNNDVILTYGYSSVVKEVICKAYQQNKKFSVIIVDSRPKLEGQEMLRYLLKKGIPCSYTLISALSYVMKNVSKVIIGAHALQANGYVMSRIGCSQIALVASWYNVPVLVCCETYKFCERVHTDSFVYNELGDPQCLVQVNFSDFSNILQNWKDLKSLHILNLTYDITPPDLVTVVVTEKGMLPCTSVPVVLRVRHAGAHDL